MTKGPGEEEEEEGKDDRESKKRQVVSLVKRKGKKTWMYEMRADETKETEKRALLHLTMTWGERKRLSSRTIVVWNFFRCSLTVPWVSRERERGTDTREDMKFIQSRNEWMKRRRRPWKERKRRRKDSHEQIVRSKDGNFSDVIISWKLSFSWEKHTDHCVYNGLSSLLTEESLHIFFLTWIHVSLHPQGVRKGSVELL